MTDKEMNKLADIIVDKLLTTYIREQAQWYSNNTFDMFMNKSNKPWWWVPEDLGKKLVGDHYYDKNK